MPRLAPFLLLLLGLAGCTAWPPPSSGGAAERLPLPEPRLEEDLGLRHRLECDLARLESLAGQAETLGRFGGQLGQARDTAARATREYAGGLHIDAPRTLELLETRLAALAQALGAPPRPPAGACR